MADAALFIGWGQVVRGREKRAVQVFNESVEYWGEGCRATARSRTSRWCSWRRTAATFRASPCCAAARSRSASCCADEESGAASRGADQIIDSQGVIDAAIGEGIARGMAQYQGEVDDLD